MKQQDNNIHSAQKQFRLHMRNLIKGHTPEKQLEILYQQLDAFLCQTTQMLKCQITLLPEPYTKIITHYAKNIIQNCSFQNYPMDYPIFFHRCCNILKPYISKNLKPSETEELLTKEGIVFLQPKEEYSLILTIQQTNIIQREIQQILKYSIKKENSKETACFEFVTNSLFCYALTFYLPFLHKRKKQFYTVIRAAHCEEAVEQALVSMFWEELLTFCTDKDIRFTTVLYYKTSTVIQNVINQQYPFSMDLRMRKTTHLIVSELMNENYYSPNIVKSISAKYHIRLKYVQLLWASGGEIYAMPKSFEALTDVDFSNSYTSSEISDIELYLSITQNLSSLEKSIFCDILEYGNVILQKNHTRLGISRYRYEKIRKQVLNKLQDIY